MYEEVGEWLAHQFITNECQPIFDPLKRTAVQTARRRIETSSGPLIFTHECEPYGMTADWEQTTEGCDGQYVHDFEGGKSYLKKRWHHALLGYPVYMTGCLQSDESHPHQIEIKGYEHNDEERVSKPKTTIFIKTSQGRIKISPSQVRQNTIAQPYVFREEKEVPSSARVTYYDGCHKMTPHDKVNIYKRIDGTFYEQAIGQGKLVRGPNECRTEQRSWREDQGDRVMYYAQTLTHYPDGRVVASSPVNVGQTRCGGDDGHKGRKGQ